MWPMLSVVRLESATRRVDGHFGRLDGQLHRGAGREPELGDRTGSDLRREVPTGEVGADPDAVAQGFEATVRLDACRGIDLNGSVEAMLNRMREAGVRLA